MKVRNLALLAVLALALIAGCTGVGVAPPTESSLPEGPYKIGSGDNVGVRVWKNPELTVEVPVRPDGKISVPLLDDVQAAGLTADELKAVITEELAEFIAHPDVTVVVLTTMSKRAYVVGAVVRPGPVPLSTRLRVLDAISMAGGLGPFADAGNIQIIRYLENEEVIYRFDYDDYVDGKAPGTNIALEPGDTIVVPE
jgi:polysaccharide export outer membrane protein